MKKYLKILLIISLLLFPTCSLYATQNISMEIQEIKTAIQSNQKQITTVTKSLFENNIQNKDNTDNKKLLNVYFDDIRSYERWINDLLNNKQTTILQKTELNALKTMIDYTEYTKEQIDIISDDKNLGNVYDAIVNLSLLNLFIDKSVLYTL